MELVLKLEKNFYKLPFQFDSVRLKEEFNSFEASEWQEHPQNYDGNYSIRLVSVDGGENDDYFGYHAPTKNLNRMPYVKQILSIFDSVISRTRLMIVTKKNIVPMHVDLHYSWYKHVRIHIPIITNEKTLFICDKESVNMKEGECWIFDTWRNHSVINNSDSIRVHLVIDTTGSSIFWNYVENAAWYSNLKEPRYGLEFIPYRKDENPTIHYEKYLFPKIFPPSEIELICNDLTKELKIENRDSNKFAIEMLKSLKYEWQSIWGIYADSTDGYIYYENLAKELLNKLKGLKEQPIIPYNGQSLFNVLVMWLKLNIHTKVENKLEFEKPIFIVASPRSGSTLLFETLANSKVFTLGGEGHFEIESIPSLNLANRNYESNRLTSSDFSEDVKNQLIQNYLKKLQDRDGNLFLSLKDKPNSIRFLEKTPKNSLRIPFLKRVFPDAKFIYLKRDAIENISSIIDAWKSENFVTYKDLPNWDYEYKWSLVLPEGWQEFKNKNLAEIAKFQYDSVNLQIVKDLNRLNQNDWIEVTYEDLLSDTSNTIKKLLEFMEIEVDERVQMVISTPLKNSKYTLTAPKKEKWRKNIKLLKTIFNIKEDN
jgi:LPS sulfotransferase NodH